MSSSIAAASTSVSAMNTAASNVLSSLPGSRPLSSQQQPAAAAIPTITAQFREIHKNTWLKRLTAEGKKICVGPKKSERSWVVFCVHDDTEALLEGYAEPRQAPSHNPEWVVSMKDTLHISHALIPNSHEFEFVVTLSTEVVRFHAMSWDIMQEWVETLRSKLREMKILSPRENLYTKLPEVRAPLLPTRDPTSPLPAPPPVPAAIVPGVERVIPHGVHQPTTESFLQNTDARNSVNNLMSSLISNEISINASALPETASSNNFTETLTATQATSTSTVVTPQLTAMSNTLTQNLLNMLSDPISAYSEQINDANSSSTVEPEDITGSSLSLAMGRGLNLSESSSEEEFMAPLLRKPSANNSDSNCSSNNSVRLDVLASHRASADQIRSLENFLQCDRYIQRPQSSRSLSAGAVDKSKRQNANQNANSNIKLQSLMVSTNNGNNITELEVNSEAAIESPNTNITIIQVSTQNTSASEKNVSSNNSEYEPPSLPHKTTAITGDVFKYPDSHVSVTKNNKHLEYKSNVQIIPSSSNNSRINNINDLSSSTIKVISDSTGIVASSNQYTTPVKKQQNVVSGVASTTTKDEHSKITTVHVAGSDNTYGTCFTAPLPSASTSHTSTPKMPKKIILSANTSGITNITINNTTTEKKTEPTAGVLTKNICSDNLENDFSTVVNTDTTSFATATNLNSKNNSIHYEKVFLTTSTSASNTESNDCLQPTTSSSQNASAMSPNWNSPRHRQSKHVLKDKLPAELSLISNSLEKRVKTQKTKVNNGEHCHKSETRESMQQEKTIEHLTSSINMGSPVTIRKTFASPTTSRPTQPTLRPPFHLRRGLTEAVITSRPSRKDSHFHNKISVAKTKPSQSSSNSNASKTNMTNNNESSQLPTDAQLALNRVPSERKRSSSTSDAQAQRHIRSTNNNDPSTRMNNGSGGGGPLRQPSQPFRLTENILGVSSTSGNIGPHSTTSPAKRMTLREQQVMQLRREIMHPGGVRLQLRRKDCVGSIAWVDAFGAIWVAGWKQKEYPVLYNAVHIGDQLLSIAGNTVSSAVEANKIIRNTNTIFVEVLVRRIPFGRGYAIRREREGQCLGLIRDGNTATIVDIVPNSLAARHGLPPKAQSCDGTTLTFWVLTEINGRPLNLFFKENEIRDRLNSVGRDISILVQPSDLITKLKKQLKSLRGYKDYLVQ